MAALSHRSIAGPSRLPLLASSSSSSLPRSLPRIPPHLCHVPHRDFSNTPYLSSGSNKWSKIRHKKAANDTARGNAFGRLTRDLVAAIRTGGADPISNTRLAILLKKAKEVSFPKDRLERTFEKAQKSGDAGTHVTYEALGPAASNGASIALIIECGTDSPGRTHAKVKEIFNKSGSSGGGRLSSVSHLFQRRGVLRVSPGEGKTFDQVFELALEHGAEEVNEVEESESEGEEKAMSEGKTIIEVSRRTSDEVRFLMAVADHYVLAVLQILCEPTRVNSISSILSSADHGGPHLIHEAEQRMLPIDPPLRIRPTESEEDVQAGDVDGIDGGWIDEEVVERLDKLVELLEETADCQRVWSNIQGWP